MGAKGRDGREGMMWKQCGESEEEEGRKGRGSEGGNGRGQELFCGRGQGNICLITNVRGQMSA